VGSRAGYGDDRARESSIPRPKGVLRDYTETILVCVIFVIFTRAFVFQQSKIPSGSMLDTLLVGDYIMVNRFVYAPTLFDWEDALLPVRPIRRGDVAVFKFPDEPEVDYIKRVIGIPGDDIEFRDGYLFVNGEFVEEPYVQSQYRALDTTRNKNFQIHVPTGEYLMLGDHRNRSSDSREWGTVPRELIKGRALLIWYSYDEEASTGRESAAEQVRGWGSKILNFFGKSRFSRCFTLIR
jgi:signal peptidase I